MKLNKKLCQAGNEVDILLPHDAPYGTIINGAGSRDVLELIEGFQPAYHFCGHHHSNGKKLHVPGSTRSYHLNEVSFRKPRIINPGCFGILKWAGREKSRFGIVEDEWLNEYTRDNYREL